MRDASHRCCTLSPVAQGAILTLCLKHLKRDTTNVDMCGESICRNRHQTKISVN